MRLALSLTSCFALAASVAGAQISALPSNGLIREYLVDRIDIQKQGLGIVVGVIDASGRRVVAYGRRAAADTTPLDGETMFEIGSISKVFTSLVLADMVQRGELALTDPISKYLPATVKVPSRDGKPITLVDLATHTSGLPRLPTNFQPKDPDNPYADYTADKLYAFLTSYQLPRDIGGRYEYSNLGGGLLGHLLARRAGMEYEALVKSRVAAPLGLKHLTIALSPDERAAMATGHDGGLKAVPLWDSGTLAGAYALHANANTLLDFLSAATGLTPSPLSEAFATMLATRRPTGARNLDVALAWHVTTAGNRQLVWHNGGTGGFRTFIGFDPVAKTGVVVLSNVASLAGPDDIGLHILDGRAPLLSGNLAPKQRTEVTVAPALLDKYTGRYQLTPNITLTVTREATHLSVQLTGQPSYDAFAESEKDFFLRAVDAQLTFTVDADGRATEVIVHQAGRDQRAPRTN